MYLTKRVLFYELNNEYNLLINTISGAFDIVDNDTKYKINNIQNMDILKEKDLIQTLIDRKYLFEDVKEEEEYIEKFIGLNKLMQNKSNYSKFTICPTMGCNLRCTYCFEGEESLKNNELMSNKQLESIFTFIKENIDEKEMNEISLFGGEPLLKSNYDIVKKVLEFADEYNIVVKIITNGTTIEDFKDLFINHPDVLVQITLDGDRIIHNKRRIRVDNSGTFDQISQNIDKLIELKILTRIRVNIDKENINEIPALIEYIDLKGWVDTGYIIPYVSPVLDYTTGDDNVFSEGELFTNLNKTIPDIGKEDSIIKNVMAPVIGYLNNFFNLESKEKMKPWKTHYCEATSGDNLIFSPDGRITTCLLLTGKKGNEIGFFNERGVYIDKIQSDMWSQRSIFRIPKCKDCKYALLCGGGCPVAAIEINKDIDCPHCSDINNAMEAYVDKIKYDLLSQAGI